MVPRTAGGWHKRSEYRGFTAHLHRVRGTASLEKERARLNSRVHLPDAEIS
jgi:hypothetical protein